MSSILLIFIVGIIIFVSLSFSTSSVSGGISSHVLDVSIGKPASNFEIISYFKENDNWIKQSQSLTDVGGRVASVIGNNTINKGVYKLVFNTKSYYGDKETFYPYVEVIFEVNDPNSHYHIPLTLSPYSYSTYKGSA